MVSEMTGSYQLLLPTMWVSTLCFLLALRWTLYTHQVPTRLDSPAHQGDFLVDVLEGITVNDVYRRDRVVKTVPEATSLAEITKMLSRTPIIRMGHRSCTREMIVFSSRVRFS